MKAKLFSLSAFLFLVRFVFAQSLSDTTWKETPITLETKTGKIYGTLLTPKNFYSIPVVLIIAGSGPTDRNGNNPYLSSKNNSLKMLAEELSKHTIASLRYDKRGIGESKDAGPKEKDLLFDNYVEDAMGWIDFLKADKLFSKVIVIGHSEGSLIGMIAADKTNADAFISLAGAGQSADKILKEQLKSQPSYVTDAAYPIIDSLANGDTVVNVPMGLYALFRPSVQPYMISWFRYNPQAEIKKLAIPILVVQGTTDIQISTDDAKALADPNPKAKLAIIDGMNHILKEADADREKNIATYNKPDLPLAKKFTEEIISFIENLK